ncbi:hypothetical protein [Janibacter corallicola]|uniref:hypothetical protein n=1 Tax=Janibacter corallicola TaxID=415212 RepID=UPI000ADE3C19|nr:hypothetical protein [Janibacter corallicola]
MPNKETPLQRHQRVLAASEETDGVLDHTRLRALDVDRNQAARQVAAGRWARHGKYTLAMHNGPLGHVARCWRAVWEVGENVTLVDGVSALQLAGLRGWHEEVVHVSLVHRHDPSFTSGVKAHKVIRRVEGERAGAGLPRTRPPVAAIRAANWAVSDRAAATILAMTVQQRLATGEQLVDARRRVRGRRRRAFLRQVVQDIADGAQSLHELDFAGACRKRALPEPTRQALRRTKDGRIYLDVFFEEYGLVVEVDGAGHQWGLAGVDDSFRANAVVIDGDRVLRINIVGWRLDREAYLDQVTAALRSDWALANLARSRPVAGDVN